MNEKLTDFDECDYHELANIKVGLLFGVITTAFDDWYFESFILR